MICFLFIIFTFLSLLNLKIKRATRCCGSGPRASRSHFLKLPSRRENPPHFSLRLSILAGTNLIMLLLFFYCNPRLIPKKIHPLFDFRENSSSFDFRENPCKTPKETKKNCFFFASYVFSLQNPRLIPKKIHSPFDFQENSSSFDFRENPCKTPKENQKNCFSFAPCVFWICPGGLFAFVPLDLKFTNPKSTIFELG